MKVAVIDPSFSSSESALQEIIDHFNSSGEIIYDGSRNVVKMFSLHERQVVVKGFKPPHVVNKFVYRFFRKSKAHRSYEYAQKLKSLSIGTPQPIAYFENFTGFAFLDSYYISEFQKSDLTYRELITNPKYPNRIQILKEFTAFTKKIHDNHILFKDHSPGNTLIKKSASGKYEFYLVDLNRMEFRELTLDERIQNFSRLTPRRDMVEIMAKTYAELGGYNPDMVFEKMWAETRKFQEKFHRKRRMKRNVFFWKKKYKK